MATDATGPVTVPDNIPTILVGVDAPTGNGENAMMAQIQAIIAGLRIGTAPGGKIQASTALTATGTPSASTVLAGNDTWITVAAAAPTGALSMYAAASAPAGWLLCDGSVISRTTFATLFGVISTAYGVGDGSTTFGIPDLRGRMPVGFAASGGHADVATLGNNDGAALASRRPKHNHTITRDAGNAGAGNFVSSNNTDTSTNTVTGTVGPQTGAEPLDTPAYVVVNYIIKT